MVNATAKKDLASQHEAKEESPPSVLQLHADFQNILSYIHPDAESIIGLQRRHVDLLREKVHDRFLLSLEEWDTSVPSDTRLEHGIPLLLPLTVGIEFEKKTYDRQPAEKRLVVNVDSLSMVVSSEDVRLVNSILGKLTKKKNGKSNGGRMFVFDVKFDTERLGLGLRKDGNRIVVDHVGVAAREMSIESGDIVHSINGSIVSNTGLTLSEMVGRLSAATRPLTITFARTLPVKATEEAEEEFAPELGCESQEEIYQGSYDTVDVTLSSAAVTIMERDVSLLRGHVFGVEVGLKRERTSNTVYSIQMTTKVELDYYNLRVWCWEPLLEPGSLFLSAEFQDPHRGPKEVSIEVGDRSNTPLCVNLSDAAVESFSKFMRWGLFPDGTNVSDEDEQGLIAYKSDGIVSKNAAHAALVFAERQKSDSAKPFVFRNKTGVSVAFASQAAKATGENTEFAAIGEYHGLEGLKVSDVTVVADGEEVNFRMDVVADSKDAGRGKRFPPLTVAFQAIGDTRVDPLQDLDISSAGETSLPLPILRHGKTSPQTRLWVSWVVEHTDEKTILTLCTALRVVSLVREPFEVGVEVIDATADRAKSRPNSVKAIGSVSPEQPLYLPLSLAMQPRQWRCHGRLVGRGKYLPLFLVNPDGTVGCECTTGDYVDFSTSEMPSKIFLSLLAEEIDDVFTLTVDCAMSLRNLLPSSLSWEVAIGTEESGSIVDSSYLRSRDPDDSVSLASGERAEIFSNGCQSLRLRFQVAAENSWSSWIPLDFPPSEGKNLVDSCTQTAVIVDSVGISLPLGVRIVKRYSGIDVLVFAELWCSNCTSLPIVFGSPINYLHDPRGEGAPAPTSESELSAAEAALKEISSLFELGEEGKDMSGRQGITPSRQGVVDILRVPCQTGQLIVEEAFEYVELNSYGNVKRRWWGSTNPRSLREPAVDSFNDGKSWNWLDEHWVRPFPRKSTSRMLRF